MEVSKLIQNMREQGIGIWTEGGKIRYLKKDGKLVEGADEIAAELIHQSLIQYINATDVEWKDIVYVRCELSGDTVTVYIDEGKYDYTCIIQE